MQDNPGSVTQTETRKLAAIMFTDIVGFSHQMGTDETRMLRLLAVHNQVIERAVAAHQGHIIKTAGDGFLIEFASAVHAVQCAQHIQAQFRTHTAETGEPIHVRIGIHLGDIVQRDGDVFGDGVNVASRLQALAESDTICISQAVHKEVEKKLTLGTVVSLGRPKLKNIAERVQVYVLLLEKPKGLRQNLRVQRLKLRRLGTAHLSWPVVMLAGALLIAGTTYTVRYFSRPPLSTQHSALGTDAAPAALPLPDRPSIIVLPFDNMSDDPGQDYFSDGLTEILTTDLSQIPSLFVIARNSAFTYKGKAAKVQDVSQEMGVRYVLEGGVLRTEGQVRITAQLIDAVTGYHLWAERYDRPFTEIFALQDELVKKIVTTLNLQIAVQEQGFTVRKTTTNLEAYDALLRGVGYGGRLAKETNSQARQMYEHAIVLDPQYAVAYALLGWTYYWESIYQWNPDPQNLERAGELARQALALNERLPDAHGLLSRVYWQKQQPELALAAAEQAVVFAPNYAEAYIYRARALGAVDRPAEALRNVEQAMRLNPRYPFWYSDDLAQAYRLLGRYEEAVAAHQQTIRRNPQYQFAYVFLALSYADAWLSQQRQEPQTPDQALEAARRAVTLNASSSAAHVALGVAALLNKDYAQAEAEVDQVLVLNPGSADLYASAAGILNSVGRPVAALKLMEQALHLNPRLPSWYFLFLGQAYYLLGRTEEAVAPLQRVFSVYPHRIDTHLLLAAVYSELGREAEARAEVAEVLRINPQFSREVYKERVPIKDSAVLERQLAALRKAGLG